jgi:hypothetical protein
VKVNSRYGHSRPLGSGWTGTLTELGEVDWQFSREMWRHGKKGHDMTSIQCSCGFMELDDEGIIDHLHRVFTPDDGIGNDGQVHEEQGRQTCACGLVASTPEELDTHFLKVFMPADLVGRDGKKHEVRDAP